MLDLNQHQQERDVQILEERGNMAGRMSGLRKARCVRTKIAEGHSKTKARDMCGVKSK